MSLNVQHVLDRFDTCVASLRDQHDPQGPGFGIALTLNGQAIRNACHGQALIEWPQPLTGDTRLYLASESKFWVAALVMDSVAAGRVALDADMRQALPALAGCTQPVRLGHLLRHTSGVDDYLYLWHMQLGHDEDDLVTQEQALALIRRAGASISSLAHVTTTAIATTCCWPTGWSATPAGCLARSHAIASLRPGG